MSDVLVVHAIEDSTWVGTLASALRSRAFDVVIEAHGTTTPNGQPARALGANVAVIVVWSKASAERECVLAAAKQASDGRALQGVTILGGVPPSEFTDRIPVDLTRWDGSAGAAAIDELTTELTKLFARLAENPEHTRIAPPRTGETVGNYKILRQLGEGGSGFTHLAENVHHAHARVALKVITSNEVTLRIELLRHEAKILARLQHKAVVQYRHFGPWRSEYYLAVDYLGGKTLRRKVPRAGLSKDDVIVLGQRLEGGLNYIHGEGVVHRDLSPANIVLRNDSLTSATLIDFGIATLNGENPLGEGFYGKLEWAAPEQIEGKVTGPAADLYSLGLILAFAARGTPLPMGNPDLPFEQEKCLALKLRETVPPLDGVDPELQPIIAALLAPEPSERSSALLRAAQRPGAQPSHEVAKPSREEDTLPASPPAAAPNAAEDAPTIAAHSQVLVAPPGAVVKMPPSLIPSTQGARKRDPSFARGGALALGVAAAIALTAWGVSALIPPAPKADAARAVAQSPAGRAVADPAADERRTAAMARAADEDRWAAAQRSGDLAGLQAYLSACDGSGPTCAHRDDAVRLISDLEAKAENDRRIAADQERWSLADKSGDVAKLKTYLAACDDPANTCAHRAVAVRQLAAAEDALREPYDVTRFPADLAAAVRNAREAKETALSGRSLVREAVARAEEAERRARSGASGYVVLRYTEGGTYAGETIKDDLVAYGVTHLDETMNYSGANVGHGSCGSGLVRYRGAFGSPSSRTFDGVDEVSGSCDEVSGHVVGERRYKSGSFVRYWGEAGGFSWSGFGVSESNAETRYEGQVVDAQRNGLGVEWDAKGRPVRYGVWKDGQLVRDYAKT